MVAWLQSLVNGSVVRFDDLDPRVYNFFFFFNINLFNTVNLFSREIPYMLTRISRDRSLLRNLYGNNGSEGP